MMSGARHWTSVVVFCDYYHAADDVATCVSGEPQNQRKTDVNQNDDSSLITYVKKK